MKKMRSLRSASKKGKFKAMSIVIDYQKYKKEAFFPVSKKLTWSLFFLLCWFLSRPQSHFLASFEPFFQEHRVFEKCRWWWWPCRRREILSPATGPPYLSKFWRAATAKARQRMPCKPHSHHEALKYLLYFTGSRPTQTRGRQSGIPDMDYGKY